VLLLGLTGCDTQVKESDVFVQEEHMTPERRRASPDTRAKIDAAMERSRRSIEEAAYGKPIVTTWAPPTGPMIVPGSRVTLLIEAIDMGHGLAMEPATIAMFVPTPTPRTPRRDCWECMKVQRERGMNSTDGNVGIPAVPYVVRQEFPAFLEDRHFYTMGVGGVYEVPEVHHTIHGDRATIPSPPRAPSGDLRIASRAPKLKVTVLSACKADVRRVAIRYFEWHITELVPVRVRHDGWNEFHGCKGS